MNSSGLVERARGSWKRAQTGSTGLATNAGNGGSTSKEDGFLSMSCLGT